MASDADEYVNVEMEFQILCYYAIRVQSDTHCSKAESSPASYTDMYDPLKSGCRKR
jgi:hypothetical protein